MTRILIAGGTGFVGRHLISFLLKQGYALSILSRKALPPANNMVYYRWNIDQGYIDPKAFEGVDTIINLTGANIGEKRWTPKRKQMLIDSRVKSINLLYKYVSENAFPVQTLISSSAVGYYGATTGDAIYTESDPPGNDFLSSICIQWENAAQQFQQLGTRVIILRKGVIIGPDGGFFGKMAPLARRGINPALGSGKQYIPWMDIGDLVRLYGFMLEHTDLSGIFNAVSTQHLTMNDMANRVLQQFGKRKRTPNVPAFVIRLLFGEMSVIMLCGSRVSNEKIRDAGFRFIPEVQV